MVKSLKFGTQFPSRGRRGKYSDFELEGLSALEDRTYSIEELHSAPHHYIKVAFFVRGEGGGSSWFCLFVLTPIECTRVGGRVYLLACLVFVFCFLSLVSSREGVTYMEVRRHSLILLDGRRCP